MTSTEEEIDLNRFLKSRIHQTPVQTIITCDSPLPQAFASVLASKPPTPSANDSAA